MPDIITAVLYNHNKPVISLNVSPSARIEKSHLSRKKYAPQQKFRLGVLFLLEIKLQIYYQQNLTMYMINIASYRKVA